MSESKGAERHLYPGGNTAKGFFSYYQYILGQREANKLICIKGGPGVGKSTFMKKIGEALLDKGENIDFMHCSSDDESLDGILLKDKKIAYIDATSPHMVDPVNPGAVDSIIHLGDFWDEAGIRKNKEEIISSNEKIKEHFQNAYNFIAAAEKIYDNLTCLYSSKTEKGEIYKLTAKLIDRELGSKDISLNIGSVKKFFASAITPTGFHHHIKSLIRGYDKIYFLVTPVGFDNSLMMDTLAQSAIFRGLHLETYYCPMKPAEKTEHLLIPELGVAFVTLNDYHDIEPWEIGEDTRDENPEINLIDFNDLLRQGQIQKRKLFIRTCEDTMKNLLEEGVKCIAKAKKEHDNLEDYYIPNMNFKKIDLLKDEIIAELVEKVL